MRIGLLAFATKTGLGYQAKSYFKHLPVTKVLELDNRIHNNYKQENWYPDSIKVNGVPAVKILDKFVDNLDVIIFAETPVNLEIYEIARSKNVKTVNIVNWEYFDSSIMGKNLVPDAIIMPSVWYFNAARQFCDKTDVGLYQLHHPVDRADFPFRLRKSFDHFHVAGQPLRHDDRNGTLDYLKAFPDGLVTIQNKKTARFLKRSYRNAKIVKNVESKDLYDFGDTLVLPRHYGGNCLPLNEAISCGLPVVMPDASPNSNLLPNGWLVPVENSGELEIVSKIDTHSVSSQLLRDKVASVSKNIIENSKIANDIAETISWDNMKAEYIHVLEKIISN
ncbi:hypothetical protein KBB17_04330 [Candidatus Saccharibacteria bacterium]|nr:hypothetical protein [Candidatus Saccharibacteria bacterium]